MGSLPVVFLYPPIQLSLKVVGVGKYSLSENCLVKLIQNRLVETLADTIRLRMSRLSPSVFDFV